jgi:hypothetical protein
MSRINTAGSSITDLIGIQPRARIDGGSPAIWQFPELIGTQIFRAGEMVCLSGVSGAAIGITKPLTDASGYGIVGFAADNATGVGSTMRGVYIAGTETLFVGNVGHATSASAQTAATDIGQECGLTSLSGRTYVDKSKTSGMTTMCRIVGFHEQDAVPSYYGRVYFQVNLESLQLCRARQVTFSGSIARLP